MAEGLEQALRSFLFRQAVSDMWKVLAFSDWAAITQYYVGVVEDWTAIFRKWYVL